MTSSPSGPLPSCQPPSFLGRALRVSAETYGQAHALVHARPYSLVIRSSVQHPTRFDLNFHIHIYSIGSPPTSREHFLDICAKSFPCVLRVYACFSKFKPSSPVHSARIEFYSLRITCRLVG